MTRRRGFAVLAALAVMVPEVAGAVVPAHAPVGGSGVIAGLLHPLVVPEHLLALVGLGLLIGQQDQGRGALSVAFAAGLVAGLAAIALAAGESHANEALIACAAVAGSLVALARPVTPVIGWPLAAAVGTAIGLDSPPEVVDLRVAGMMLVGTLVGAIVVVAAIVKLVVWLDADWQRVGVRVVGSWTAAAGILVLALRFAA
jgi:urease accessory protein